MDGRNQPARVHNEPHEREHHGRTRRSGADPGCAKVATPFLSSSASPMRSSCTAAGEPGAGPTRSAVAATAG